jgi:threonine/homoserine/homoserine lactone efflux protein
MDLSIYLAFVAATAVMIFLPGPSVILTVAHGVSFGWRAALITVAGATAGVAVQLAIATIGLVSVLEVVADAFEWIRWAGVAYLIYLGVKQWRGADKLAVVEAPAASRRSLFMQGLVVTIPNPKSLIFIAAFLPQFLDPARPLATQLAIILPTFLAITFLVTGVWAVAAGHARRFIQNARARRAMARVSGGLLVTAGIGLALARR